MAGRSRLRSAPHAERDSERARGALRRAAAAFLPTQRRFGTCCHVGKHSRYSLRCLARSSENEALEVEIPDECSGELAIVRLSFLFLFRDTLISILANMLIS